MALLFLLLYSRFGERTLWYAGLVDWIYLLCIYLFLMGVRFFLLMIMFPFLSKLGHKCTFKEALFIAWGGLRGALAIVLALIVEINQEDLGMSTPCAEQLFFYVGGIAALTLIINATTAERVLSILGLVGVVRQEEVIIRRQLRHEIRYKMEKILNEVTKSMDFTDDRSGKVRSALRMFDIDDEISLENESMSEWLFDPARTVMQTVVTSTGGKSTEGVKNGSEGSTLLNAELLAYIRTIFLEIVRVSYWDYVHEGKLPRQSFATRFLLYSIDEGLSCVQDKNGLYYCSCADFAFDWVCIGKEVKTNEKLGLKFLSFCDWLSPSSVKIFKVYHSWLRARREIRIVYMLTSFIHAHKHAQKRIHESIGSVINRQVWRESVGRRTFSGTPHSNIPEVLVVVKESESAVEDAKNLLNALDHEQVGDILTKQAIQMVLSKQNGLINEMRTEGLLDEKSTNIFLKETNENLKDIWRMERKDKRNHTRVSARATRATTITGDNADTTLRNSTLNVMHEASIIDKDL